MSGLSEFLGDSVRPVEVELRGADVSPLQLRDDPVADAAGKLDSLPAERVTPPPRGFVSKRPRETGEQPDPELDAVLAEHGQTLLEQRHEPDVVRRSSPDDAPAIAS